MFRIILSCIISIVFLKANAQSHDSLHIDYLESVTIVGRNSKTDYQQMPEIVGTNIYAGKKSALVVMKNVQGNIVNNTMRQVLAKVAGIHVWESDASGLQIGIAARGLSPNRSWEFNVRQNGYDIAADPYGYPEAYYNPQLQAVQRIEIVRGQGALQYGPQFGGLVNYILKDGSDFKKSLETEVNITAGSFGLFNGFVGLGGKSKKFNYYAFSNYKTGNGFRDNSFFKTYSNFATVTYAPSDKLNMSFQIMQSSLRSQQPGGLTDAELYSNPTTSHRTRNWFDISWLTPAFILNYNFSSRTRLNTKIFATIGNRNSVGFMQGVNIKDSINSLTNTYNNRVLNEDKYRNIGMETRFITNYKAFKTENTFTAGIRAYTGNTFRKADGKGSTGTDYDMNVIGLYNRDINFSSKNLAAFLENIFRIGNKLLVIPGVRYEWLQGNANGRNGFAADGSEILLQNITRARSFTLVGLGAEFHVSKGTEVYANYSQSYRPIQFANLQAPPTTDVVDPNLTDSKGYNIDLGYRGKISSYLTFDVSAYFLTYNNRVGTITTPTYRLITNVGNSISKGLETFIQWNLLKCFEKNSAKDLFLFTTYSYTNATYSSNHKDANIAGKKVENAPEHILRTGITYANKKITFTTQYSFVSSTFSDANNTKQPTINGNNGLIPSYEIVDFTFGYTASNAISLKAGLNNVLNKIYFSRRAGGYPGPGALVADGRNFFISIDCKF